MTIEVQFDHSLKLGRTTYSGTISQEDFDHYMKSWANPDVMSFDELVTGEELIHIDASLLLQHSREVLKLDPYFAPGVRTAIVEQPSSAFSYGEFWANAYDMVTDAGREVRVFDDERQALEWLKSGRA